MQFFFKKLTIIFKHFRWNHRGNILLFAMVFGFISFSVIVVGVTGYAISENRASVYKHNREMAFQIAESGINYYRWHLAHNKTDYYDGQGASSTGPYVHEYDDKDGNLMGYFSLEISPSPVGSTIVIITSTGWVANQEASKRSIKVRIGFPSLTDYSFLTNTDVWIGDTETTHGKFHANGGIRYDGVGDAPITSAVATYTCKTYHACANVTKPGIWGTGGPTEYWAFPMPSEDFSAVTAKLAEIQEGAENGGLPLSSSGKYGYRLEFTSDGKINVYKVNSVNCYSGKSVGDNKFHTYCIDIKTLDTPVDYDVPTSGYIYVDDNVWVDGTVNGRATIGTSVGNSIIINGNILYLAKDGNHVLGLIGEQNILVPYNSPNNLEIDAAVLAQNGAAQRYSYPGNKRNSITIYGSIITNGVWTWTWFSGGSYQSGYKYTYSTYDANLTYGPPPGFPVGSEYNLISWEEVEY
jgi:hypothetical protein